MIDTEIATLSKLRPSIIYETEWDGGINDKNAKKYMVVYSPVDKDLYYIEMAFRKDPTNLIVRSSGFKTQFSAMESLNDIIDADIVDSTMYRKKNKISMSKHKSCSCKKK
jgi:hypothetical protein